ncbi:MAG TPA: hypothetical protein VH328_14260 [Burkholderiaceae bacterium]|nr:hypothetical protein [Burkholderiaceae bacterium]
MSVVQAGLAFRVARPIDDFSALLLRIHARPVEELVQPSQEGFDLRRPGDIMVQTFHDACFICNLALGLSAIQAGTTETTRLHAALGAPATVLAFCHDDAHGRHGYALVTRGRMVRRRLQTAAGVDPRGGSAARPGSSDAAPGREAPGPTPAGLPPPSRLAQVHEQGSPQPFERRWLSASSFIETPETPDAAPRRVYYLGDREILVPESALTARLLHDGLEALLGVCPWDSLITPRYRFFRIAGAANLADSAQLSQPPRASPWWRRLWR